MKQLSELKNKSKQIPQDVPSFSFEMMVFDVFGGFSFASFFLSFIFVRKENIKTEVGKKSFLFPETVCKRKVNWQLTSLAEFYYKLYGK